MSSPDPIDRCLAAGRASRPLPWVYRLAARIESVEGRAFDADPDVLERTLRSVAGLFDLPAVPVPFDTTVLAEAMGCAVDWSATAPRVAAGCVRTVDDALDLPIAGVTERDRVASTVDAVARLTTTLSARSVVACVPSPSHLASALTTPDAAADASEEAAWSAGDAVVEAARGYLDADADALAVLAPDRPDDERAARDALEPVVNAADYYGRRSILVTRSLDDDRVAFADAVGFDAVTGLPAGDLSAVESISVGYGEATDRFVDGPRPRTDVPDGCDFLTSEWALPQAATVDRVHHFAQTSP